VNREVDQQDGRSLGQARMTEPRQIVSAHAGKRTAIPRRTDSRRVAASTKTIEKSLTDILTGGAYSLRFAHERHDRVFSAELVSTKPFAKSSLKCSALTATAECNRSLPTTQRKREHIPQWVGPSSVLF